MLKWFLVFLSMILASCAQLTQEKSKRQTEKPSKAHLSSEQIKNLNEKAVKKVSRQLKELALAAKASGKDKVQFLASDMYLKASAAQMEGDFKTGNLIFEHLIELAPEDSFIQKKYAIGLIRTGELEKSQEILEKLYKKSAKKDHDVGLILAGVYSSLGKSKLALGAYKNILKQDPKNEDACIFLSKTQNLLKKSKKAMGTLQACESRFKNKGVFSYYMGKMLVDKGELERAKKHFKRAAKLEPGFSQATMALGLVHEEQGKSDDAIKIYKSYLKQKPNDTLILSRLTQLMFTVERFKEAIPFAERLSDYDPENLNLKVKLGILYTDQKAYDKAITTFKELLTAAPDSDKILYYLGAIYQEIKEFENAVDYFTR
ncbi:MAG: tetratricopeptide repeat protein, partial [Bacteriovoracaceae bacterium]